MLQYNILNYKNIITYHFRECWDNLSKCCEWLVDIGALFQPCAFRSCGIRSLTPSQVNQAYLAHLKQIKLIGSQESRFETESQSSPIHMHEIMSISHDKVLIKQRIFTLSDGTTTCLVAQGLSISLQKISALCSFFSHTISSSFELALPADGRNQTGRHL